MGKLIPKLSASVNASRRSPDHCLLIFPTSVLPSVNEIERKNSNMILLLFPALIDYLLLFFVI
jgi:hypothetical protein